MYAEAVVRTSADENASYGTAKDEVKLFSLDRNGSLTD